jgi:hypothetical protein
LQIWTVRFASLLGVAIFFALEQSELKPENVTLRVLLDFEIAFY